MRDDRCPFGRRETRDELHSTERHGPYGEPRTPGTSLQDEREYPPAPSLRSIRDLTPYAVPTRPIRPNATDRTKTVVCCLNLFRWCG
jgi:hypothetical protein